MIQRCLAITWNTYREAVRARILHGLVGLAILTLGYAIVVGAYALRNQNRVVADLGSASISVYSIVVAIVLAGTSLYRELELKTIFPILARPMGRGEYLFGKFLGVTLTLFVFIVANAGLLLVAVGVQAGRGWQSFWLPFTVLVVAVSAAALKSSPGRTWLPIPTAFILFCLGLYLAAPVVGEARVIVRQALLTMLEVSIVSAITLLYASFSSPFLTAVFTLCTVIVGRSADTLASLPVRMFGEAIVRTGKGLALLFPNLLVYVPPRAFLTGEAPGPGFWPYWGMASLQALGWVVGLLGFGTLVFRRRDFL